MNTFFRWIEGKGIEIGVALLAAIAIYYVGGFVLERLIKQAVRNTGRHRNWHRKDVEKRQNTLVDLFRNIWKAIVTFGFVVSIIYITVPNASNVLAPLFASAGIIGIALGFGAQSLIKDFLSGIFIIAENQYRVGDIVQIGDASGTVERIGTRSTVLRDADGNVHYLPNGLVTHVVNKTMGFSKARFSLLIHPSADIDTVIAIINETGEMLAGEDTWKKKVITPPAFAAVGEFTANSVEIQVTGTTQPSDQWSVTSEMRIRLLEALEKAKIPLATATSKKSV